MRSPSLHSRLRWRNNSPQLCSLRRCTLCDACDVGDGIVQRRDCFVCVVPSFAWVQLFQLVDKFFFKLIVLASGGLLTSPATAATIATTTATSRLVSEQTLCVQIGQIGRFSCELCFDLGAILCHPMYRRAVRGESWQ